MVKHVIIYDINRLIVSDLQCTYDGEKREISMKILVIGNGFDLEHGLPTKYKDFLDFMQGIKLLSSKDRIIEKQSFIEELETTTKHKVDQNIKEYLTQEKFLDPSFMKEWKEEEISKELIDGANNNIWIKYFIENMNYEKDGWIDLESEISNVIKYVDYSKNISNYLKKFNEWPLDRDRENYKENIVEKIIKFSGLKIQFFELVGKSLENLINTIDIHLNDLIRCLEIYLEDCVGKMQIKYRSPDLENLNPDRVLSFNYTKTHKKYYECAEAKHINVGGNAYIKEEQYEYIHGQAILSREKENNNMVLGIDEYLDKDNRDKELEFIQFKKYYQRIYKKTGLEYSTWINGIQSNSHPNDIYIFGHSIDVTDKDILKKLLVESNKEGSHNTKITIFYHDKKQYAQQIVNLVKIIKSDELIERVSGAYPTIIFKQQKQRIKIN